MICLENFELRGLRRRELEPYPEMRSLDTRRLLKCTHMTQERPRYRPKNAGRIQKNDIKISLRITAPRERSARIEREHTSCANAGVKCQVTAVWHARCQQPDVLIPHSRDEPGGVFLRVEAANSRQNRRSAVNEMADRALNGNPPHSLDVNFLDPNCTCDDLQIQNLTYVPALSPIPPLTKSSPATPL
jgi:hypothetical protein